MADVFISYSSKDRRQAGLLAEALSARGLSVWWDREILTGQAFDHAIERELESARHVVVLWSANSVDSEWVKNEAAAAAERGVLLPANIDGTKLPLEFRRKQTADLTGWRGEAAHEGFAALCRAIDGRSDRAASSAGPAVTPAPVAATSRRTLVVGIGAAVALAIVVAVGLSGKGASAVPAERPAAATSIGGPATAQAATPATAPVAADATATDLAASVVGTYVGAVIADSKGSSRSDVAVRVERLGPQSVRVTSPYARMGTVDVALTRIDRKIFNADGDTPFAVDLAATPPSLTVNPRNELAYSGTRQP